MDPITHTLTGAALAATGWRRRTALATPAAILAANAPDIDILAYSHGEYAALAFRRGWTHGPLALLLLAGVVTLLALGWDRIRRRQQADRAPPARAGALLGLSMVAVATHPVLDWMNTYGVRWLMPLDTRWYYGDALFIIDPWLWLALGIPLFLVHSQRPAGIAAWAVLALAASTLVLGSGIAPTVAGVAWVAALAMAAALRARWPAAHWADRSPAVGSAALIAAGSYILTMVVATSVETRVVRAHAEAAGVAYERIMLSPEPANPFAARIVIDDGSAYWLGRFDWSNAPRVRLEAQPIAHGAFDAPALAATALPNVRDYLRWSRFPIVTTTADPDGFLVRFADARFLDRRTSSSLAGIAIRLDHELQPR
jgi:inner membrane protein